MEGVFKPTLNLGNSVIGVGILAMPYCIEKCGLVLGLCLLALSATFTIWSLKMLVRSAQLTHKSSYEQLAYHTFGRHGKLVIELSIIGLTIGCLISFFIVIGDLAPPIVAKSLGINWSPSYLRMVLMTFFAFAVSLPLSLLRNIDSLSGVAISSLFFYSCLLLRIVLMSFTSIANTDVWKTISLVKFEGLLHCLPICALALSCHPQMFVIYIQMADPSIRKMSTVINGSIYMVATGYGLMAFFGYMMFSQDDIKGDVLKNFPHDGLSQLFRFGFSMSVVVSFPLVVFPVRASIYSLLFSKQSSSADLQGAEPIPHNIFNMITVAIITGTLTIALLVPNVEAVLALTGATTGSIVSYIFPSLIFLSVVGSHAPFSNRAKFLAVLGVLVMVVGTATIVSEHIKGEEHPRLPDHKYFPRPFAPQANGPAVDDVILHPPPAAADAPQLPGVNGDDVIKNNVIGDDVIQKEEVHVPPADNVQPVSDEGKKKKGEGVREGGVEGKVGGGGVQKEHESIRKDVEELKERIKAVEEENKELKDVLELNQKQQVGEEHADMEKLKEVPAVPVVPNAVAGGDIAPVAPIDNVKEKRLVEEAGQQGVEPVGGAKVELVNNNNPVNVEKEEGKELLKEKIVENLGVGPPNPVEKEGKEFGVVDEKVVEELGKGVEGGPPAVGVAEGVKREVADKREVRGEEEEEVGEKAVGGGEDKVTGRELKALKGHG